MNVKFILIILFYFILIGMKFWIKYGNEEARIDLEGCEYVVDLRKIKFMKKFGIQVPSTKFDS